MNYNVSSIVKGVCRIATLQKVGQRKAQQRNFSYIGLQNSLEWFGGYVEKICSFKRQYLNNFNRSLNRNYLKRCRFRIFEHCLEPVKFTVLALCQTDANLYTADVALNIMFEELKRINSDLSIRIYDALKHRISQRRTTASEVLSYLTNPKGSPAKWVVSAANATTISRYIRKLAKRLSSPSRSVPLALADDSDDDIPIAQLRQREADFYITTISTSLKEKLDMALKEAITEITALSTTAIDPSIPKSFKEILNKKINLFENGGNRGQFLQFGYELLSTIPPTSVESELKTNEKYVIK